MPRTVACVGCRLYRSSRMRCARSLKTASFEATTGWAGWGCGREDPHAAAKRAPTAITFHFLLFTFHFLLSCLSLCINCVKELSVGGEETGSCDALPQHD